MTSECRGKLEFPLEALGAAGLVAQLRLTAQPALEPATAAPRDDGSLNLHSVDFFEYPKSGMGGIVTLYAHFSDLRGLPAELVVRANEVTAKRERDRVLRPRLVRRSARKSEALVQLQSSVSRLVLAHESRHRKPRGST